MNTPEASKPGEVHGKALSDVEVIKMHSDGLFHPLEDEIEEREQPFSTSAAQVLKFHGIAQQFQRDTIAERKAVGLPPEVSYGVHVNVPGGRLPASQYLRLDNVTAHAGDGHIRITSRQALLFHAISRGELNDVVMDINQKAGLSTWGHSADLVRNVCVPPLCDIDPAYGAAGAQLMTLGTQIQRHFTPRSTAYNELWLQQTTESSAGRMEHERSYGPGYLPRKFKISLGADFDNATDVMIQDLGLMAVFEQGHLAGFEVFAGGGLGYTPGMAGTAAMLGMNLAFVPARDVLPMLDAVVAVFNEHGERKNRSRARFKYLLRDLGLEHFRELVSQKLGQALPPPRNVLPTGRLDYMGWHDQSQDGLCYLGLWLPNGHIADTPGGARYRGALRALCQEVQPEVRLTPDYGLLLANIPQNQKGLVEDILQAHGVPLPKSIPALRQREMACPALPYCGRAFTEGERLLEPTMKALLEAGYGDERVDIRMTGCPNGCARPRTAEIGILAHSKSHYVIYVGGDRTGTLLNEPLIDKVSPEQVPNRVAALLSCWKAGRREGEAFGDWARRITLPALGALLET